MSDDLPTLRRAAKRLRRGFATEPTARARVEAVLGPCEALKHADALHVIAREAGYESWPKLKFAHEAARMSRAARVERLERALYFGQAWVVSALLGDDPGLSADDLGLMLATYDLAGVRRALERPGAATTPIRKRPPIAHLAFSHYIHMAPEKSADMLRIADLLLAAGADPNDGVPAEPGSEHRLSMLYGALGHANNLALTEWLLQRGATPDDNESLYHATELPHADGLRLLIRHKVRVSGTNALPRALDFDDAEKVRLLLDAGADPNEAVQGHPSGQPIDTIPALHQAARRWCGAEVVRALLRQGADPALRWRGLSAYETARLFGNHAAAAVLDAAGHGQDLDPDMALLAACADGTPPGRRLDPARLPREVQRLPVEIAGRPGRLAHLEALMLAGLDPDATNDMGLTPLHIAAWEGVAEHVRYFLTLSPDLAYKNAYGGDALGTAIHGAEFSPHRAERDHIACAALLLAAGAVLDPRQAEETGNEAMALFLSERSGAGGM